MCKRIILRGSGESVLPSFSQATRGGVGWHRSSSILLVQVSGFSFLIFFKHENFESKTLLAGQR